MTGSIAAQLVARGWRRDDSPGHPGECGAVGPSTGFCARSARWVNPYGTRRCAVHALALDH